MFAEIRLDFIHVNKLTVFWAKQSLEHQTLKWMRNGFVENELWERQGQKRVTDKKSEGGGTCASGTSCTYSGLWTVCHLDCPVGQLARERKRERKTKTTTRAQWVTHARQLLPRHTATTDVTEQRNRSHSFIKHYRKALVHGCCIWWTGAPCWPSAVSP